MIFALPAYGTQKGKSVTDNGVMSTDNLFPVYITFLQYLFVTAIAEHMVIFTSI